MANPMNEAFGMLLSAVKNGAKNGVNGNGNGLKNGLKISNNPTINQINAQDWRFDGDDLILDTPDKKAYYQMLVGAGGGVKRKDNLFANEIDLFKKKESIRNVIVHEKQDINQGKFISLTKKIPSLRKNESR